MNRRRLLAGAVVASVLATVLSVTWTALTPLPDPPAETVPAGVAGEPPAEVPGLSAAEAAPPGPEWSVAWATAPSSAIDDFDRGLRGFTFRNVVHTTVGGPRARVRLTNRFGTAPVRFGHVTVAVSAHTGGQRDGRGEPSDGTVKPGTLRSLTFGGLGHVTVPAGADVLSDPVDLTVPADHDLLVSIWTPWLSGAVTHHLNARQISFASHGPQDRAADAVATGFRIRSRYWYYMSAVEVTGAAGTIVALGDSITDGGHSTLGANRRWPDYLAARLAADRGVPDYGVANSGISGNRLLDNPFRRGRLPLYAPGGRAAQLRFDHDVLKRPGARTVVIMIGINDIMRTDRTPQVEQIKAGLSSLAARAKERDLRVVVATMTPWKGSKRYNARHDVVRLRVNEWIRGGGGGAFDAVADFDRALRDPADPLRLRPEADGGDRLHPSDAGNRLMAAAVPLEEL